MVGVCICKRLCEWQSAYAGTRFVKSDLGGLDGFVDQNVVNPYLQSLRGPMGTGLTSRLLINESMSSGCIRPAWSAFWIELCNMRQ